MTYSITKNPAFNSLEITFDGKPSEAVRNAIKALKFRWHAVKKVWYGYASEEDINAAIRGAEKPLLIPESKFVDGGGMYDGWEGGNNRKWNDDKQLKAFLLSDFKKAGIPATVRFNRAGYLTSLTVTIKINAEDIKPFEEWGKDFHVVAGHWHYYTEENGSLNSIFGENYYSLSSEEQEKLFDNIRRTTYKLSIDHLTESGNYHKSDEDILTEDANKRFATVRAIVSSYNRDCSNSMIDYFDRDIYDHYTFKIA